jgi:hypothetical protein
VWQFCWCSSFGFRSAAPFAMTIKRIESLSKRMQVLENTVAICKRVVEKQQPAHVEYKEQLTELMKVSTELNQSVAAISAKRAEEQKMYITALDSINKGERERESLNRRLTERQCKLTVFLMILRCASYLASMMRRKRCKNSRWPKKNARLLGTKLLKASFFLTNNRKKSKSCVTR